MRLVPLRQCPMSLPELRRQEGLARDIPDQGAGEPPAVGLCLDDLAAFQRCKVGGKRARIQEWIGCQDALLVEARPDDARRPDHHSLALGQPPEPGAEDLLHPDREPETTELGERKGEASVGLPGRAHDRDGLLRSELERQFDREERAPLDLAAKEGPDGLVQRLHAEGIAGDLLCHVRWQRLESQQQGAALTQVARDLGRGVDGAVVCSWRSRGRDGITARRGKRRFRQGTHEQEQHDRLHASVDCPHQLPGRRVHPLTIVENDQQWGLTGCPIQELDEHPDCVLPSRWARHLPESGIVESEIEDFVQQGRPRLQIGPLRQALLDQQRALVWIPDGRQSQCLGEHPLPCVVRAWVQVITPAGETETGP